jgi:hypothetical protein
VVVTVAAFMVLDEWLDAFGPIVLSGQHWLGKMLSIVLLLTGILLLIGFGSERVDWAADRSLPFVAASIASLALLGMFGVIKDVVAEHAFSERGRTTSCRVLHIEERVVTNAGITPGSYVETTWHDHRLGCDAALGSIMITERERAGKPRQYVRVQFDPAGRLDPRFAENVDGLGLPLWICGVGLVVAVALWSFAESGTGRKSSTDLPS